MFEHGGSDVVGKKGEGCLAPAGGDAGEGEFMEDVDEGFLHPGCFCMSCLQSGDPAGCEWIRVAFFFGEPAVEGYMGAGGEVFGAGSESDSVKQGVESFSFRFAKVKISCSSHD